MAGGKFNPLTETERPGTYINLESTRRDIVGIATRGIALVPLIEHSYGPAKQFITLNNDSPDAARSLLGFSIFDDDPNMLLIREAFKNARTVIVYIPSQGAKATMISGALSATARYGGSRGNAIKCSVTANPIADFDVTIFLDTVIVSEYRGLATIEELIERNDPWIEFSGTGALTDVAGVALTGGMDGTLVVSDITEFLDASESLRWNTLAFPIEATGQSGDPAPALYAAVLSKIKYLREDVGKYRKAVVPNFKANYEGIINVTNSVMLGDLALTTAQVTAWVAGADAGASNVKSNTLELYVGATGIVGQKNNIAATEAIRNGEFFFSFSEEGTVVVDYDINSLTTFNFPKDKTYRKNRVIRVFDTFAEALMANFPPNKFNNSPTDWEIMEGIGRSILRQFGPDGVGALKNIDFESDFFVDRTISEDDKTYFIVGLEAVDSSEKLFFTIKTR